MATGDTLFVLTPQSAVPPTANAATQDSVVDGSTPGITFPSIDFDGNADEHMDWHVTIPSAYDATTGFTFSYKYAMDGADVDIVEIEFRALHVDDLDILTADLMMDDQTETAIQDTPAGTADKINYTGIGTMAKANYGSAVKGDRLIIRYR